VASIRETVMLVAPEKKILVHYRLEAKKRISRKVQFFKKWEDKRDLESHSHEIQKKADLFS